MRDFSTISIAANDRPSSARIVWQTVMYDEALAASVVAAFFAAILSAIVVLGFSSDYRFLLQGVETSGQVLGKQIVAANRRPVVVAGVLAHGGRKGPRTMVDYEFTDATGGIIRGRSPVSASRWDDIRVGDAVQVIYLPDEPGWNRLVDASVTPLPLIVCFTIAAGAAICTCLLMLWVGIGHVRTNLDLFQSGEPVRASVVDIQGGTRRRSKRADRTLRYQYQAPDPLSGQLVSFAGECPSAGRHGQTAELGHALLVFYDEHDPQRHAVDRYGLFPLDRQT